jgi:hypothetical protein
LEISRSGSSLWEPIRAISEVWLRAFGPVPVCPALLQPSFQIPEMRRYL